MTTITLVIGGKTVTLERIDNESFRGEECKNCYMEPFNCDCLNCDGYIYQEQKKSTITFEETATDKIRLYINGNYICSLMVGDETTIPTQHLSNCLS